MLPGAPDVVRARATVPPAPVGGGGAGVVEGGPECPPLIVVTYVARRVKPFNSAPVQRRVVANEAEFLGALRGAYPSVSSSSSICIASMNALQMSALHDEG